MDIEVKQRRVMLLLTAHTYRAPAFLAAAEQLGIEVVQVLDMPRQLAGQQPVELALDYQDVDTAVTTITQYAQTHPLDAILAVDDSGSLLAARASAELGLPHNDPAAADAARNKYRMRQLLSQAGILSPRFRRFSTDDAIDVVAAQVGYPSVVKPLTLSGSRGVIRVNDAAALVTAVARLTAILDKTGPGPHHYLVEDFIPGVEVALEGMLDNGNLTVLALFDKPDPLDGPFFEETIYVTPSRLPPAAQKAIADCTAQAAAALGLRRGPVHAELRLNDDGPWLVEIAGRSIGGLCSQTLRFGPDVSLEALILRQACGLPWQFTPSSQASGVMMIPIPEAGLLKGITGIEAAEAVPLIESVEITAPLNYPLVPLPEGESYLGFIFARGEMATAVEEALRQAHRQLRFQIAPLISLAISRHPSSAS
ncbi:MAG: ATP-grasp domain-containing protein [Ardenticatenaceae bacterium]|nr:ATP-grasp domain-containing protein [Ardenticatenaceae bacterium]